MESSTYPDKKVIAKSREFVNVAVHTSKGHMRDHIMPTGEMKKLCEHYWNITCDVHNQAYKEARNKYAGISGMPTTLFAMPTGEEIEDSRHAGGLGGSELIKKMEEALEKVPGEKIHYDQWNLAKTNLADGETAYTAGDFKKSVALWTKVSKMKERPLSKMSEEPLQRVQAKGLELLEAAKGQLESEPEAAKKQIKSIADDFKGLDVSRAATELLKTLK
jgi:hypothetical protein